MAPCLEGTRRCPAPWGLCRAGDKALKAQPGEALSNALSKVTPAQPSPGKWPEELLTSACLHPTPTTTFCPSLYPIQVHPPHAPNPPATPSILHHQTQPACSLPLFPALKAPLSPWLLVKPPWSTHNPLLVLGTLRGTSHQAWAQWLGTGSPHSSLQAPTLENRSWNRRF